MSVCKDEVKYIIRPVKLEDAEAVLDIHHSVIAEGEYFIKVSEEFTRTLEQQKEWIQKIIENEKDTLMVAEINGEIAGWIVFLSQDRKRLSHTGSFGLMINKNYRGIGIGRNLVTALLDWAEKNPSIEKVSLGVYSTNHKAISLYKSLGFIEEGRKIKEFKMNENEYVDDILMYKLV
ncbi:GNAT family N-acetyltransferase [Fictibacillus barbaricus]|uniref:RimJ/RimL family protein N-acetyltransferase n=1 Tax=Fictibacillus barbaricus TaxID=182136 RepID=A0ABU1TV09_9BACL|nr:GNAT family protein [Fictibacillus barbaricus]MDR7071052.1 RimJ/RimL family protein N-acetyltransferase [Fictibacillus barbaricus]